MNRFRLTSIALATVLGTVVAIAQQPFRLVFANTEISAVLRAIGLKSGSNIVYVGQDDPRVTINVTAGSTDDALRFVTTAAGVTYRRVGSTYVVAKPEDMRKALEPFGLRYRVTLANLKPQDAVQALQAALPYLTVQPAGTAVLLTGTRDDIDQAKEIIAEQERMAESVPTVTEIVPLRVVKAESVTTVLAEMFRDVRIRAVAQEGAGSLILTGPSESVAAARQMLALLDSKNPLPGSEEVFQVYEIRYSSASPLMGFLKQAMPDVETIVAPDNYVPSSINFRPLSGAVVRDAFGGGGAAGGSGQNTGFGGAGTTQDQTPNQKAKRIVLRGPRERVDSAMSLLASIDLRPKQVMIEVKVVDYSPSSDSQIGFNWDWMSFNFYERPPGQGFDIEGEDPIAPFDTFTSKPAGFGTFSRMPWAFQTILQAAITRREARLLATPSVQVIDGEDANIFIGDTIRAQVSSTGALGGSNVEIVEFPIGIILLVRPRVNADGDITLRVHPVVSTITSLDEDNVPQTSTREAETTLVIKDGETMVLGGLIRDEMSKTVREVPFLSKLPLIGELFRSTTTNGRKSEILVFVTPRIVDSTDMTAQANPNTQPPDKGGKAPEKKKQ
jgi:general secretion pathway protein D